MPAQRGVPIERPKQPRADTVSKREFHLAHMTQMNECRRSAKRRTRARERKKTERPDRNRNPPKTTKVQVHGIKEKAGWQQIGPFSLCKHKEKPERGTCTWRPLPKRTHMVSEISINGERLTGEPHAGCQRKRAVQRPGIHSTVGVVKRKKKLCPSRRL